MKMRGGRAHLEGVLPADVVIHGQHGDVEAGQEDASQDAFLFVVCTTEEEEEQYIFITMEKTL